MSRIDEIREQREKDLARFDRHGHHFGRAEIRKMLNSIDYLLSLVKDSGAEDVKASYSVAHEARYLLTHPVHPDIVVLWFLALKSHWFDDPHNLFYGQRERAKAFLYKWVETGKIADDDNTTLQISVAMKFREWLESSWTTAPTETSTQCYGMRPTPIDGSPETVKCEVLDCNESQICFHYCQEHHFAICKPPRASVFSASTGMAGERSIKTEMPSPHRMDQLIEICDKAACDESAEYVLAATLTGAADEAGITPDGDDFETRCKQRKVFTGRVIEIIRQRCTVQCDTCACSTFGVPGSACMSIENKCPGTMRAIGSASRS